MQEWIIAMLVISVLLILRDMAKTILTGRMSKKEEAFSLCEEHPQKEKVERYAASFQKLADTFYGMPYKKEFWWRRTLRYVRTVIIGNCAGETARPNCVKVWRVLYGQWKLVMKKNLTNSVHSGRNYVGKHTSIWM